LSKTVENSTLVVFFNAPDEGKTMLSIGWTIKYQNSNSVQEKNCCSDKIRTVDAVKDAYILYTISLQFIIKLFCDNTSNTKQLIILPLINYKKFFQP
jgi:hypothetical protein